MRRALFLILLTIGSIAAMAQQPAPSVPIKVSKVADNLHLLQGDRGGNILVSIGEDGVFMIDTQTEKNAMPIFQAVKTLTAKPVRYIVNTHYHSDHTDGNVLYKDAVIVAHENVRKRLASGGVGGNYDSFRFEYKALPKSALPAFTFSDEVTLHFNGEDIRIAHLPNSHTDGDTIVYFPKSNVVHLGDEFVTYGFPDIEIASGGSVQGNIDVLEKIVKAVPEDVVVVPGHGPVSNLNDVRRFVDMLKGTHAAVKKGIRQGKSMAQLQQEKVLEPWKSWAGGLFNADVFIEFLYNDLTGKKTWGPKSSP